MRKRSCEAQGLAGGLRLDDLDRGLGKGRLEVATGAEMEPTPTAVLRVERSMSPSRVPAVGKIAMDRQVIGVLRDLEAAGDQSPD